MVGGAFVLLAVNGFPLIGGGGGGSGSSGAQSPRLRVDRFDAPRAMEFVREQVEEYGWRPAGSPASRRLAERLRTMLPNGHFEAVPRDLWHGARGLRNVVGYLPGRPPAIVLGAHYDVEAHPVGFVGANDGAAGTAAVVAVADALSGERRPAGARQIRFVLFDGEEEPAGTPDSQFAQVALRGSRAYVRAHRREVGQMVLLDYIANRGLRLPRETSSSAAVWKQVRAAARRVGAGPVFPSGVQGTILDDHTPFLSAGIPAVDLIDFSYRYADTLRDTPDKLSVGALDAVGETVVEYLRRQ